MRFRQVRRQTDRRRQRDLDLAELAASTTRIMNLICTITRYLSLTQTGCESRVGDIIECPQNGLLHDRRDVIITS